MDGNVSICIPVYNGARYIKKMIESIIGQSHKNLEIIISDNASTDDTVKIVEEIKRLDDRLILNKNMENIGYCANIWKAVSLATSEYIAIYHADDIYDPDIVREECKILFNNASISAVFTKRKIFWQSIKKARKIKIFSAKNGKNQYSRKLNAFICRGSEYLSVLLRYGNIFSCPSFMTRKSVFINIGGFQDNYASNEDLELWIKYLNSGMTIAIIDKYLLYYRVSPTQVSSYWAKKNDMPIIYNVLKEMILDNTRSKRMHDLFKTNIAIGYLYCGAKNIRNGKLKAGLALVLRSDKLEPLILSIIRIVRQKIIGITLDL